MPAHDERVLMMLALEHLAGKAARTRDFHLLGVVAEAWGRRWAEWALIAVVEDAAWQGNDRPRLWSKADAKRMVEQCRYGKNRAKLRHQADALWAALPALPFAQGDWTRARCSEEVAA